MNTEWPAICKKCNAAHPFNKHINMESIKYTLNKEEFKKILKAAGWAFGAAGFYALSEWVLTADLQVNVVWIPVLNTLFYAIAKFMEGNKK